MYDGFVRMFTCAYMLPVGLLLEVQDNSHGRSGLDSVQVQCVLTCTTGHALGFLRVTPRRCKRRETFWNLNSYT